ncbi:hypothetical protein HKD37_16G044953 [Glycine soja]
MQLLGALDAVSPLVAKLFLALMRSNSDTTQSLGLTRGREPFRQEIIFHIHNQLKQAITWNM